MSTTKNLKLDSGLPYLLLGGGLIGLFSAAVLMVEKLHLLENPTDKLNCDINPIISCGSVILTDQANAFGFPNPIVGIAGFSIIATLGLAILAGAKFKRWFWLIVQLGVTFGVVFVHWLIFQTLYRIGALCPYCMVVWSVMIPIFWYATLYNLRHGYIKISRGNSFLQKHHGDILLVWLVIIIGLIAERFWYFWSTLI